MRRRLDVAKSWMVMCLCRWPALTSTGDCGEEFADDAGERLEDCRWSMVASQAVTGG